VTEGVDLQRRPVALDAGEDGLAYNDNGKWVEAKDIVVGDSVELATGENSMVKELEYRYASLPVYNLKVDELHTFAVCRESR
jgi:hypothetical protein